MSVDHYVSQPAISSRNRRLFTFVTPLQLQIQVFDDDGRLLPVLVAVSAAEGVEDTYDVDSGCVFLVLERLCGPDGREFPPMPPLPDRPVIGVWVAQANVAARQINLVPWDRTSILDLPPEKARP